MNLSCVPTGEPPRGISSVLSRWGCWWVCVEAPCSVCNFLVCTSSSKHLRPLRSRGGEISRDEEVERDQEQKKKID